MGVVVSVLAFATLGAAVTSAETVSLSLNGGSLSVTTTDVTLHVPTSDDPNRVARSAAEANRWLVEDSRGTGAGWHLTIGYRHLSSRPERGPILPGDQGFKIQLLDRNIKVVAGNTEPRSTVSSLTPVPEVGAGALTFASAGLGEGMGSYVLHPSFELEVPADSPWATFTAAITVTAVTGP